MTRFVVHGCGSLSSYVHAPISLGVDAIDAYVTPRGESLLSVLTPNFECLALEVLPRRPQL